MYFMSPVNDSSFSNWDTSVRNFLSFIIRILQIQCIEDRKDKRLIVLLCTCFLSNEVVTLFLQGKTLPLLTACLKSNLRPDIC